MKNKLWIASFLGSMLLSSVALSNAVADELTWLNTHDFIAGENVTLSYSAPYYPGSIAVKLMDTPVPAGEPDTSTLEPPVWASSRSAVDTVSSARVPNPVRMV